MKTGNRKQMETATRTGMTLICLMELAPLVIGVVLGMWLERRKAGRGWGGLVPARIREWMENL